MSNEKESPSGECQRLRTAMGSILGCHSDPIAPTKLCPECEHLANLGARGLFDEMTLAQARATCKRL